MLDAIVGAVGGVKGALDIAKGLNSTITSAQIAEVKASLIERLSDAHIALADAREQEQLLRDRIRALEAENAKLKEFDADAERYELADTGRGALAYRLKGTSPDYKSGDWLCPHCFAERKASHLIPDTAGMMHILRCHPCDFRVKCG